jgi:hypothetical protein
VGRRVSIVVNRLLRWMPPGNRTLETGVAALAGFLAGHALQGEWPLLERVIALLFGG